ncbi:MAG: STN domain-containing protein [Spongiibacteraceae bacterium]
MQLYLRRFVLLAVCALAQLVLSTTAYCSEIFSFNISAMPVDIALRRLAQQSNTPLLFSHDKLQNIYAQPVVGNYSVRSALTILLKNTGIHGDLNNDGVLTVSLERENSHNGNNKMIK